MPLYEYICDSCHDEFELLVRGNETPVCPDCGGKHLRQQLSVVATHTHARRELPLCANPSPTGTSSAGCGLPACGGGRCAMPE